MKAVSIVLSLCSLTLAACVAPSLARADSICDFDGDGMSEIAFVTANDQGNYDWTAFDPRSGRTKTVIQNFGNASSKLIPGNWFESGKAVAAIVNPVGGGITLRATWIAQSVDYAGGTAVMRELGRSGDIIIQGGDYDGNGITDSLILKRTTGKLGLRVNYFLSTYNGNNLGKERLYKALGRPFRDQNFFFSPDGSSDYLAVLRRGSRSRATALQLKPFTDSPQALSLGSLPGASGGLLPVKQGSGKPDLLLATATRGEKTQLTVKTLRGLPVFTKSVDGSGAVMVGDYLSDTGWEIAIQNGQSITFVNPKTKTEYVASTAPSGQAVSCISNQMID